MADEPNSPQPPVPPFRSPDSIDVGCMVGLGLILIGLPVSLYVAAPVTVLVITAAVLAWGLMRLTPKRIRNTIGYGKVWCIWFAILVVIEIVVGLYLDYLSSHGGNF